MLDCVIDCRKWSIKEKSQQPDSVGIVNKLLNLVSLIGQLREWQALKT